MVTHHPEALREAQLTETERRVVKHLLALLEQELGDQLLAVWLYGSRARGEADLEETHHDRRSDVDLMVVVEGIGKHVTLAEEHPGAPVGSGIFLVL